MFEGQLTGLLSRTVEGGLERAVYEVSPLGLNAVIEKAKRMGDNRVIDEALCGWYCSTPRPNPEDIMAKYMQPAESGRIRVELIIRRGHLMLAGLLKNHKNITISDGVVKCSCHPETERIIPDTSLPEYVSFNF